MLGLFLAGRSIGYRVFGGTKFFDRKEIKDGIAYMRVALNPRDELSLRRIVNTPARGLGAQSLRHIVEHGETQRMSLLRALNNADQIVALSPGYEEYRTKTDRRIPVVVLDPSSGSA